MERYTKEIPTRRQVQAQRRRVRRVNNEGKHAARIRLNGVGEAAIVTGTVDVGTYPRLIVRKD